MTLQKYCNDFRMVTFNCVINHSFENAYSDLMPFGEVNRRAFHADKQRYWQMRPVGPSLPYTETF